MLAINAEKQHLAEQGKGKQLTQTQLNDITVYKDRTKTIDMDMKGITEFSRTLGKVLLSSGTMVDPQYCGTLDWALIELDAERFSQKPKNIVGFIPIKTLQPNNSLFS